MWCELQYVAMSVVPFLVRWKFKLPLYAHASGPFSHSTNTLAETGEHAHIQETPTNMHACSHTHIRVVYIYFLSHTLYSGICVYVCSVCGLLLHSCSHCVDMVWSLSPITVIPSSQTTTAKRWQSNWDVVFTLINSNSSRTVSAIPSMYYLQCETTIRKPTLTQGQTHWQRYRDRLHCIWSDRVSIVLCRSF